MGIRESSKGLNHRKGAINRMALFTGCNPAPMQDNQLKGKIMKEHRNTTVTYTPQTIENADGKRVVDKELCKENSLSLKKRAVEKVPFYQGTDTPSFDAHHGDGMCFRSATGQSMPVALATPLKAHIGAVDKGGAFINDDAAIRDIAQSMRLSEHVGIAIDPEMDSLQAKASIDRLSDAELEGLGFTPDGIATLRKNAESAKAELSVKKEARAILVKNRKNRRTGKADPVEAVNQ